MSDEKNPAKSTGSVVDVSALTDTRKTTHGNFEDVSKYAQQLKQVIHRGSIERKERGQPLLTSQQMESLEMMAHKIARIIAGDASFDDHWDDIGGYARIGNRKQGK